ncbi:MAG: heme-degrading domain-containing protein [Rhizobiaceae bacterium]|nr:heme-degrading domain-containing protein [Rhizobiaceae bacterium]
MAAEDDLKIIAKQEKELVFDGFDEARAFTLGSALREIALERGLGVVVDIRFWNRPLFFAATAGVNAGNHEWVRRKINVVKRFLKSSYRMVLEQQRPDRTFAPQHGLSAEDYVLAGGGFPITVRGVGPVGAITVSGLPEREDHNLVVEALCAHLGKDHGSHALPAA